MDQKTTEFISQGEMMCENSRELLNLLQGKGLNAEDTFLATLTALQVIVDAAEQTDIEVGNSTVGERMRSFVIRMFSHPELYKDVPDDLENLTPEGEA